MPCFFQLTEAVVATTTAFAAQAQAYVQWGTLSIGLPESDGDILTINSRPLEADMHARRADLSAHAHLGLLAAASNCASAIQALERATRAIPGYPHGDALGILLQVVLTTTRPSPILTGTLCLEGAAICPSGQRQLTNAPLHGQGPILAERLTQAAQATATWTDTLAEWWVSDAPRPGRPKAPVRAVFAPGQEEALAADLWWNWRAPMAQIPSRPQTARPAPAQAA